eukprot:TRINITY_DN2021_c0_g2_i4.p1 TRINITY_DN2021_c0_g2~~TRINITY_DN2021_c0_g2_i4.p1  ORF type:complete len:267 (-),score=35.44 TRINITY_DN2021_c0_g2_i4:27-827(-)
MDKTTNPRQHRTNSDTTPQVIASPRSPPGSPAPKTPCPHYAKGKCYYGPNCKYLHEGPGGTTERPKGTIKCPFYAQGKCFYGERCQYSHGGMGAPGMGAPVGVGMMPPPGGVPVFSAFMPPSPMPISRDVPYEAMASYVAYFYQYMQLLGLTYPGSLPPPIPPPTFPFLPPHLPDTGKMLNRPSSPSSPSPKPCRFWAEGSCSYGDVCKFTHYGEAGSGIPEQWAFKRPASEMEGQKHEQDREKKRRKDSVNNQTNQQQEDEDNEE